LVGRLAIGALVGGHAGIGRARAPGIRGHALAKLDAYDPDALGIEEMAGMLEAAAAELRAMEIELPRR